MALSSVALLLESAAYAQVTPEQEALVQSVLLEIGEIDEELHAIQSNQATLNRSAAARQDEYRSLMARYPGIKIKQPVTTSGLYEALYRFRMVRAATARPIAAERLRLSQARKCDTLRRLKESRAQLEATDEYKQAKLQDRLDLRKSFDDLIADATADDATPCP